MRIFNLSNRFATRISALLLLLALVVTCASGWAASETREYDIKAAFVYNFALFIEWPPASIKGGNIVFGVLGHNDYGDALQDLTKHTVGDSHIVVKEVSSLDDAAQCQVLIIGSSEAGHYPQIFNALRGKPVLTIGETPDFAAQGGCIGFVPYRSRLRFEINVDALKRDNLKASSKLLNLATIVNDHS